MRGTRRLREDQLAEREDLAAEAAAAPHAELLALQGSAGNAAVARLLQREPAVTSLSMRGPDLRDPTERLTEGIKTDDSAAMEAVLAWFDTFAAGAAEGGGLVQSVAELVFMAGALSFTDREGKQAKVSDRLKPSGIEMVLRGRAKTLGVRLLEHRSMDDLAGVQSETQAILTNLGRIPTQVKFGGDAARLTISIMGKATGEAGSGNAKLKGEVSPGGAEVSATLPGTKVGVSITDKGVRAELKAGDLVTVVGTVGREADGSVGWKADIAIGTLGVVIGPDDIAKVMKGAQDTFGSNAEALLRGINDAAVIKEHGAPLKDAVSEVVEKARKSAEQARAGWSVGVTVKGSDAGGISASVTLTWVF